MVARLDPPAESAKQQERGARHERRQGIGAGRHELITKRPDSPQHANESEKAGREKNIRPDVMPGLGMNVFVAPALHQFGHRDSP